MYMKLKKLLILIVSLMIVALLVIAFIYGFTSQPTVPTPRSTAEVTTLDTAEDAESTAPMTVKTFTGGFEDEDETHTGSGEVTITRTDGKSTLNFAEDFKVGNGPDLFVYLSANNIDDELGKFVSLGALKSKTGSQTYDLPDNYREYPTVVIWCKSQNVAFSKAELFEVN